MLSQVSLRWGMLLGRVRVAGVGAEHNRDTDRNQSSNQVTARFFFFFFLFFFFSFWFFFFLDDISRININSTL